MTVAVRKKIPTASGRIVLVSLLSILLLPGMLAANAATKPKPLVAGTKCRSVGQTIKGARGVSLRCTRRGHNLVWMKVLPPKKHTVPPKKHATPPKKHATPSTKHTAAPSSTPSPTGTPQAATNPSPSESAATQVPEVAAFFVSMPFDLSQTESISPFRSCAGHDYSAMNMDGQPETMRSMKHYIVPPTSLIGTTNVIKLFAPFDGTVTAITVDPNAEAGYLIWLNPTQSPGWGYQLIHVTPALKVGDSFKAGQVIGYGNFAGTHLNMYDIGLERFVGQNGQLMTLDQAHQYLGDWPQLLHRGELDSIFNHMAPDVLAAFASKGITPQNMVIGTTQRDAAPCKPLDGFGHFAYDASNYLSLH